MFLPSDDNAVWVRLLRPGFEYPTHFFKHHDALYYPSEDAVFLVTKRQSSNYGYNVLTEVAIWWLEEIRLLGTLTLSVPEGGGSVVFAPWYSSVLSHIPLSADLASDSTIASCLEFAIRLRAESEQENRIPYSLRTVYRSDPDVENDLFENIDPTDGLLMRGLYTLIKSQLLIHAALDFMEEAFINLQISREAALQIIREHLHFLGNPNPGYRDVHNYILSNFQMGEPLVEYLIMQHELWIETKHAISVYGSEWAPSLTVEDIYETYECLISIYRHIVLGEPGRSSLLTTT